MFTLINADAEDDEDDEITDPLEIAQLFCAVAGTAICAGLGRDDLIALIDAEIERGGAELN